MMPTDASSSFITRILTPARPSGYGVSEERVSHAALIANYTRLYRKVFVNGKCEE